MEAFNLGSIKSTGNKIIVKIYDVDKQEKTTSKGGIITSNVLKPSMNSCQVGEAVSIGKNVMSFIKKGEIVLFNWNVEFSDDHFLGRDETGEYRYVTEKQIYGTIKNNKKTGLSHIQPKCHYILAEPIDNDIQLTKSIFQIPVAAINPNDDIPKKMGIKVGDWIVCTPYSAIPITIKRKDFFFVFLEDVLFLNYGMHKIAVNRKKVSSHLRLASRKEKIQLN